MKTETYNELKVRISAEVNAFPLGFAFSDEQLKEALAKLGATADECLSIGAGGILRKCDKAKFDALFIRHETEREAALDNDDVLREAIRYELGNHEYCITGCSGDALGALGITLDDERKKRIFNEARLEYANDFAECN